MSTPKRKGWLTTLLLVFLDLTGIYFVFWTATCIRDVLSSVSRLPPLDLNISWSVAQFGLVFIVSIFWLQGLYPGYGLTAVRELEKMTKSILLAFFLIIGVSYFNKTFQFFPRSILLLAWLFSTISLPIIHFGARNIFSRFSWYGISVTIFGDGSWADEVFRILSSMRRLGWVPKAKVSLANISLYNERNYRDSMAVLATEMDISIHEHARLLNQRFRKVVLARKADKFGSLWVEPRDLGGNLGLEFHYHLLARRNRWMKRAFDFFSSGVLLLLLSPLLFIIGIAIVINNPGPVFFRQNRLGRNFREFKVLKFRTMVIDAESRLKYLLTKNPAIRAKYEEFHKLDNDPRVTKLGLFLRKYSLDELPQLWNVFIGEMSLSGPRAYMPSELDDMRDYAEIILRVLPGMTGWWQVFGRHTTTFDKRLYLDEYYISNWSLWMDAYIFMRTIFVVLKGDGA